MRVRASTLPVLATSLVIALGADAVCAQAWPVRPVTVIVPYPAGGPTDLLARVVAKKIGAGLGQTFVVDNRAGAGGTIGVAAAIRAAADGYTIALTGPGPLAGMPHLTKMPFATSDYQHVTLVARVPSVIVVAANSGITSLPDLVAKAKAAPGKLNYGSAGNGTTPHIGFELLKQQAGIEVTHVPYKGAAPAVTALLGGEIQAAMVDLTPVLQHVVAGKLKALAVAGPARAPQIPDVPTTREAGLPGVLMDTDYGVVAPKGVPVDVLTKLQAAFATALQSPDVNKQFLDLGAIPSPSTGEEYARKMAAESEKWRGVISRGKITLD